MSWLFLIHYELSDYQKIVFVFQSNFGWSRSGWSTPPRCKIFIQQSLSKRFKISTSQITTINATKVQTLLEYLTSHGIYFLYLDLIKF